MAKAFLSFACVLVCHATSALAAPLSLRNETTTVVVNGGEMGNGLVPYGGFLEYRDHAHGNEETTWSIDPVLIAGGRAVNLAAVRTGGFGAPAKGEEDSIVCATRLGKTDVSCKIELVKSSARQTFKFKGDKLDGVTFLYYAENDLFGHANDVAAYTGSIKQGDLALFMFDSHDGGLSVKLTGEAVSGSQLTLFGGGIWTEWGSRLERGDLRVLSPNGGNFARYGDLGLALAFELSGQEATVVINYDTQPAPPDDPQSLKYLEKTAQGYQPYDPEKDRTSTSETGDGSVSTTPIVPPRETAANQELTKVRIWTLATGRTMQGVVVGAVKKFMSVKIQLTSGRIVTLKIDKLSPADQELLAPLLE